MAEPGPASNEIKRPSNKTTGSPKRAQEAVNASAELAETYETEAQQRRTEAVG
jgi:hypothetical protein